VALAVTALVASVASAGAFAPEFAVTAAIAIVGVALASRVRPPDGWRERATDAGTRAGTARATPTPGE
jgi:hypothetical protein